MNMIPEMSDAGSETGIPLDKLNSTPEEGAGEIDPQELQKGIEMEMEHTDDPAVAEKIARDHLAEIPDYYTRLEAMESEALGEEGADGAMLGEEPNGNGEEEPGEEDDGGDHSQEEEEPGEEMGQVDQNSDESLQAYMESLKTKKRKGKIPPKPTPSIEE